MRLPASRPLAAAAALGFALMTGCAPPTGPGGPSSSATPSNAAPDTVSPWVTPTVTGGEVMPDVPVSPGGSTAPRSTEATPSGTAQGCYPSVAGLVSAPIPHGHDWAEARVCQESIAWSRGDGDWQVRTDKLATSGLDDLIAALEQPDASTDPSCPAVTAGPDPRQPGAFVLVDRSGQRYLPQIPRGACGGASDDYFTALANLRWTSIVTTDLYQIRGQAQVDAGCADTSVPYVTLTANLSEPGRSDHVPDRGDATARICRYDLDPDPTNGIADRRGGTHAAGRFASAGALSDDQYDVVSSAVGRAPEALACDLPDGPWAEVYPPSPVWKVVYVELGGCNRALIDGEDFVRQLDPATVALLG